MFAERSLVLKSGILASLLKLKYSCRAQEFLRQSNLHVSIDPSPDLVIEIDVTTYTDANDYALYQLPEVWLLKRNQLTMYRLQDSAYQLQATSRYFPDVDLQALVVQCLEAAKERGTGVAIRELRQSL